MKRKTVFCLKIRRKLFYLHTRYLYKRYLRLTENLSCDSNLAGYISNEIAYLQKVLPPRLRLLIRWGKKQIKEKSKTIT